MNSLLIQKLNKSFNEGKILNNINLQFDSGKVYFILGQSGCGKTTLLNAISNEINYEGNIEYNSINIQKIEEIEPNSYKKYVVSYLKQDFKLFDFLSVEENINLSNLNDSAIPKTKNNIKKLSGGQYKCVYIEQILNKECQIVLADEPTSNLNKELADQVINDLIKFSKDKILIIVTHDEQLACKYADELVLMNDGKIRRNYRKKNALEPISLPKPPNLNKKIIKKGSNRVLLKNRQYTSIIISTLSILLSCIAIILSIFFGFKNFFNNEINKADECTYIHINQPINNEIVSNNDLELIQNLTGQTNFRKYYNDDKEFNISLGEIKLTISQEILGRPNLQCSQSMNNDELILSISNEFKELIEHTYSIENLDEYLIDNTITIDNSTFRIYDLLFNDSNVNLEIIHSNSLFYESYNSGSYSYCIEENLINEEFISFINNTDSFYLEKSGRFLILNKLKYKYINPYNINEIASNFVPCYESGNHLFLFKDGTFYSYDLNVKYNGNIYNKTLFYSPYHGELILGRKPSEDKEICISSELASKLNLDHISEIILTHGELNIPLKVVGIYACNDPYIYMSPELFNRLDNGICRDDVIDKPFEILMFDNPSKIKTIINKIRDQMPNALIESPVFETIETLNTSINRILLYSFIFISIFLVITFISISLIHENEIDSLRKPISNLFSFGYYRSDINKIIKNITIKRHMLGFLFSNTLTIFVIIFLNNILKSEGIINTNLLVYNPIITLSTLLISLLSFVLSYNLIKYKKKTQE